MRLVESALLGILQGITEFLPVSSSGHLVIVQHYLGMEKPALFLDVMLHLGTLTAVVIIFRQDLRGLIEEEWLPLKKWASLSELSARLRQARTTIFILLATVPTALMGYWGQERIERLFVNPRVVGAALIFTGTILWLTRFFREQQKEMTPYHALIIGLAQGLAITPGISRSGLTIATGLFLGLPPQLAASFSFLISIPAVLGAVLLESLQLRTVGLEDLLPILGGTLLAGLLGYLALRYLLWIVYKGRLFRFSYYCCLLGITVLLL